MYVVQCADTNSVYKKQNHKKGGQPSFLSKICILYLVKLLKLLKYSIIIYL